MCVYRGRRERGRTEGVLRIHDTATMRRRQASGACVEDAREGSVGHGRRSEEETADEGGVWMHTCMEPTFFVA
jgi:hypothetical protein